MSHLDPSFHNPITKRDPIPSSLALPEYRLKDERFFTSSASRSTGLPSWYLYQPNEQFDLLARADTCTSPANRSTSSSGWYFYQASEQVRLLADPEPLQHTSGGARTAGSERADGLTCPLAWYSYQPGGEVHRLAELVPVPAQRAGQPARWTGTVTRSACR
ncbi:hypothetical protein PCASD_14363 [Puccinia coronata f. sp. avenae]|uniref:Uncharacterized protein n=1 Tax=Puccinia coronata f. sp. avenae TaxID=200324 RepID=A0A2N5SWI5_9BASI|nr:hypothetical protein PCASD_26799 [Puccinia coronata f. sp. avenae]PLW17597.1 hypothetical protein PCASD_17645 [Puccinia coronata f. sp. avenae]PLW35539.1 hypothetical protein PCASD_14363 [Puccinia coronata f. sp. avenae]